MDSDERAAVHTNRGPDGASARAIAGFLAGQMGRPLLALTVGVSRRTLASWLSGRVNPSPRSAEQLRVTLSIWQTVAAIEAPDVVRAWFMSMKDALEDYSPAEMIAAGRGADVAAVARAYVQCS